MIELGVNIDHVATLRQARRTWSRIRSGPRSRRTWAAPTASPCTCARIGATSRTRTCAGCAISCTSSSTSRWRRPTRWSASRAAQPEMAMLVPEGRQEVTTEGGLDVAGQRDRCARRQRLAGAGIVTQRVHRRRAAPGRSLRAHRRARVRGPHRALRARIPCAGTRRAKPGRGRRARTHPRGRRGDPRSACASTPATRSTTSTCSRSPRSGVRELHIGRDRVASGVRRLREAVRR